MRKVTKKFLICFSLLTLIGCSVSDTGEGADKEKEDEIPEVVVYQKGDTQMIDDFEVRLDEVQYVDRIDISDYRHYSPDEGSKYLIVTLTVTNNGSTAKTFLPRYSLGDDIISTVHYDEEYQFHGTTILGYTRNEIVSDMINPLSSKTGDKVFTVPNEAVESADKPFVLRFSNKKEVIEFSLR